MEDINIDNNENYFLCWENEARKNYDIILKSSFLESYTKVLYRDISQPTKNFLTEYGTLAKQPGNQEQLDTKYSKAFQALDLEQEKMGYDTGNFFDNFDEDFSNENEDGETGSFCGDATTLETGINPLVEAFYHIQIGDMNWAKRNVMWIKEYSILTKKRYPSLCQDYFQGIKYLCTLLKIQMFLKEKHEMTDEVRHRLDSCRYGDLPNKGKAMVWIAKWKFFEAITWYGDSSRDKEMSVMNLQKIVSLDENNWIWHYMLSMRMRDNRYYMKSEPTASEFEAISGALEYSPSQTISALCYARLCQALFEILPAIIDNNSTDVSIFRSYLSLGSPGEVVKFILNKAEIALSSNLVCYGETIRYAKIFAKGLKDGQLKSDDWSDRFFRLCITLKPRDTDIFQGLFKAKMEEDTYRNDLMFLGFAIQFALRKYLSWTEYVKSILESSKEHEKKVEEAYDSVWNPNMWKDEDEQTLGFSFPFLHECAFLVKCKNEEDFRNWISSSRGFGYNCDPAPYVREKLLKSIGYQKGQQLSFRSKPDIFSEIESRLQKSMEAAEKNGLRLLKSKVERIRSSRRTGQPRGYNNIQENRPIQNRSNMYSQRHELSQADLDQNWRT